MDDNTEGQSRDLDNARWTMGLNRFGASLYSIEVLPPSQSFVTRFPKAKLLWSQLGVISHEMGHHIFATLYRELKSGDYRSSSGETQETPTHVSYAVRLFALYGMQSLIAALDEGFADIVSHLSFSSSGSPFYSFQLERTYEARRVASRTVSEEGEEKALSKSFLKHFFSSKRSFPPEDRITPDHQDEHTLGANLANSFDLLFGMKFGETRENLETLNKFKLVLEWMENNQSLFLKNRDRYKPLPGGYGKDPSTYNAGPAAFLEDLVWEGVNLAFIRDRTLSRLQCDVLKAKFPVYIPKWRGRYVCE